MPLVFYEQEAEDRARVTLIHHKPEQLSEERREQGIEVDEVPEKEQKEGKRSLPYIDPSTGDFWYEYEDLPEDDPHMVSLRLSEVEKAVGVKGEGKKGIAGRLDDIEERLSRLEEE